MANLILIKIKHRNKNAMLFKIFYWRINIFITSIKIICLISKTELNLINISVNNASILS